MLVMPRVQNNIVMPRVQNNHGEGSLEGRSYERNVRHVLARQCQRIRPVGAPASLPPEAFGRRERLGTGRKAEGNA
jgi:hypothetical protein